MLIAELERALLRDEDIAGSELVLQELRRTIRAAAQPVPRIGDAARLFFMPLEPFLVDGSADHKRIGRLARVSLEPIWEWIGRDLMPAEARALSEDINRALLADDHIKVEQLIRALHERAIQRMKEAIAAVGSNEKARRRLGVQVGTPRRDRGPDDADAHPRHPRRARGIGAAAAGLHSRVRARTDRAGEVLLDATAAQKSPAERCGAKIRPIPLWIWSW